MTTPNKIVYLGNFKPSTKIVRLVMDVADSSFANGPKDYESFPLPEVSSMRPDRSSLIMLRMTSVWPHADSSPYAEDDVATQLGEEVSRTVFWLIHSRTYGLDALALQVGNASRTMRVGDAVMFNAAFQHSVAAHHVWRGAVCNYLPC